MGYTKIILLVTGIYPLGLPVVQNLFYSTKNTSESSCNKTARSLRMIFKKYKIKRKTAGSLRIQNKAHGPISLAPAVSNC